MARTERLRQRHVFLTADDDARRAWRIQERGELDPRLDSQRRGAHYAAHRERDVGAAERLELRGAAIVEQRADTQRAEQFRPLEAERDGHADHFEDAAR